MEAGAAAGPAGGDAPAGGEQQQGGEQAQQQPDFGALVAEANAPLAQELEQMRSLLEGIAPQQDQSQQQQQSPFGQQQQEQQQPADLSYLNPDAPGYDPERAAEAFMQVLGQQQQQSLQPIQERMQEIAKQQDDMRTEAEYQRLAAEFPDLAEREVSDKVFQAAGDFVGQLAPTMGLSQDQAQRLAESAPILRMVYMAGRAAELANAEGQQTAGAATLEGAGGASPQQPSGGMTVESILGAGGRSALPF